MSDVTLEFNVGRKILIESKVFDVLNQYRQIDSSAHEACGVLIGEYREQHLRVVDATRPSPLDKRSRFSFFRKRKHHQESVDSAWLASQKYQTWIGEWHTHPEDYPTPSATDIKAWKKNLPKRDMILIIQGRKKWWSGLWINSEIVVLNS